MPKIAIGDFVTLMRAGYTADEIGAYIDTMTETPAQTPAQTTAPTNAETHAPTPAETPAPETQQTDPAPAESETQTMLRELLGLVRAGNINNLTHSGQAQPDAAEVMASILAPAKPTTK